MLTDEQIEKYLYGYVKRQDEFVVYVIKKIASRIGKLASFDDIYSLEQSKETMQDIQDINTAYYKLADEQRRYLQDDFFLIALYMYKEAEKFYQEYLLFQENKEVVKALNEATKLGVSQLDSLIKRPVFVMRNLANPGIVKTYSPEETYKSVMAEAFSYRHLSSDAQRIALKRTTMQLFDVGLRYMTSDTDNSYRASTSANNAIRFNVLDSMKRMIDTIQDVMGRQFGANGVQLSAHAFPAPDHAPAQGHQFSFEEFDKMQSGEDFTDANGITYAGFERQIGQWNCRHYVMKIKLGSKPEYTQEQLDNILKRNEKGYTTKDGKHYTLYECTQIQRGYERRIREAKEKYIMAKALGDTQLMQRERTRVGDLTRQYKLFSNACDLQIKTERIKIKDYQ